MIYMETYNQLQKIVQSKFNLKIVIAFLILAFYIIDFHFGVYLTPDSFAYLSGAKNLLNDKGFIYDCNNQSITGFLRLYSYFLIPFLNFGNLSSNSIIFSSILLFFISLLNDAQSNSIVDILDHEQLETMLEPSVIDLNNQALFRNI